MPRHAGSRAWISSPVFALVQRDWSTRPWARPSPADDDGRTSPKNRLQGRAMDHAKPARSSRRFGGPAQPVLLTVRLCNGHRDVPQGAGAHSSLCTGEALQEGEQERAQQELEVGTDPTLCLPRAEGVWGSDPPALTSPSAFSCHRGFYRLWEEREQDLGANPRGSPCLGQKDSLRVLETPYMGSHAQGSFR